MSRIEISKSDQIGIAVCVAIAFLMAYLTMPVMIPLLMPEGIDVNHVMWEPVISKQYVYLIVGGLFGVYGLLALINALRNSAKTGESLFGDKPIILILIIISLISAVALATAMFLGFELTSSGLTEIGSPKPLALLAGLIVAFGVFKIFDSK
jgi:hypothetical protein